VTPREHKRSNFHSRNRAGRQPVRTGDDDREGHDRGKPGRESPMAKCKRYRDLAERAKAAGDEVGVQHNLQHAEHWFRTAMADQQTGDPLRCQAGRDVRVAETV